MKSEPNEDFEDKELRSLLEEKFNQFLTEEEQEAPDDIKDQVFNTINSMILFGDIADLFTLKFAKTNLSFLDPGSINDELQGSPTNAE